MKQMESCLPGLEELSDPENKAIQGGSLISPIAFWGALAASFISNFGDFREGFSDGANAKPPRY
jgi:hypothetical protein